MSEDPLLLNAHRQLLLEAFVGILPSPVDGTMTFVRCLSAEVIDELVADPEFRLDQWDIFAVTDETDIAARQVSADRAVELREDKGEAVLLLVDISSAGAGMDGIYSAATEITQDRLMRRAIQRARRPMTKVARTFAEAAVRRARRVGERNSVSLWREFDFYARCVEKPDAVGPLVLKQA